MEPMLKAGDTLENGDYRLVLVDARQEDRISASNDPETYMFQGAKSSYNGYIEIVADITNLSGRTENILRSVECRRVFDGYVEGPLSSSIMEDEDMTHFTPMGLYGASGSRSGIHIYHGVGAVNNSEIPPGETRRVHFFWDRSDEAAAQEILAQGAKGQQEDGNIEHIVENTGEVIPVGDAEGLIDQRTDQLADTHNPAGVQVQWNQK